MLAAAPGHSRFIDGLPLLFLLPLWLTGTALASTPFVNEVADGSANSVGGRGSLALDAQGNPHASYYDGTTFDLRYARKTGGTWTVEVADGTGAVGDYTSIALDTQGNPHVTYYDFDTGNLRYVRKSGGAWLKEAADGSANLVGPYTSLALDGESNPHVSYHDVTAFDLKYARKSGGVWTTEIVDGAASSVGAYTSIALDAQGNPHVSYQDITNSNLKYARKSGGAWVIETADGSANSVGSHASLVLDASGNPHVIYVDLTTFDLKYARKAAGVWTIETADASANNTGEYTSLALDASGNPHVSYHDNTTRDLKYARKAGGVWTTEVADGSANSVGWYTSLALDAQGNPRVIYHDATTGDLKYADASVHLASPGGGVTWPVGSRQDIVWSGIGPLDILISADGGRTYERLETGITTSPFPIRVPHIPTRFARVRIERAEPLSTAASDSFFAIDASIALLKFDAAAAADGQAAALSWKTEPGPEADVRYRIERAVEGPAPFASIHAGLLTEEEFLDRGPGASARYRLIAVNGLGEEYLVGETAVATGLSGGRRLAVSPNPARDGEAAILFRVPFDPDLGAAGAAIDLSVYDASGRRIRTLESGVFAAGVRTVRWDGRDDRGRPVAAGVYFARLSTRTRVEARERIVVVR